MFFFIANRTRFFGRRESNVEVPSFSKQTTYVFLVTLVKLILEYMINKSILAKKSGATVNKYKTL